MKIKLRRIELGLTQEEFSHKVNISKVRIIEIEKGNYDYENLRLREIKKIAEVLKIPIEEFFYGFK